MINIDIRIDKELRSMLRSMFYSILKDSNRKTPIKLTMPVDKWLSANSLNLLLIFIESVKYYCKNDQIYVKIFDHIEIYKIINNYELNKEREFLNAVYQKVIFYEAVDFYQSLQKSNVRFSPSKQILEKMKFDIGELLDVNSIPKKYKYSSRMLALSPLIDDEADQINLTMRLRTLTNIFYSNLFSRITYEKAIEASSQIMYELVKNMYQHSEIDAFGNLPQGYACAQINKYPLIQNKNYPLELLASALEQVKSKTRQKNWQFLTISLNDYGVGISNKIRKNLEKHLDLFNEKKRLGRHLIDVEFLEDDSKLILLAFETNFSTKEIYDPSEYAWTLKNKEVLPLSRKGHGLIYCLGFIARSFGRIEIRSGSTILQIFATAEAPLEMEIWDNVNSLPDIFEKQFEKYFEIKSIVIPKDESYFPGTQIIIEIPIEATIN